jgi:hypothetical protein
MLVRRFRQPRLIDMHNLGSTDRHGTWSRQISSLPRFSSSLPPLLLLPLGGPGGPVKLDHTTTAHDFELFQLYRPKINQKLASASVLQ